MHKISVFMCVAAFVIIIKRYSVSKNSIKTDLVDIEELIIREEYY